MKKIINTSAAPAPIGPYSQAVAINGMLFISGQIPIDQQAEILISESIDSETEQVMKNLGFILAEAGLGYSDVVKCSIFIRNMDDFVKINSVYGKYFVDNPPARETVEVSGLPKNVNVEISCIAVFPN